MVGAEFDECIRKILQLNYGLVIISHAKEQTNKLASGEEITQIVPTLDKRGRLICERTCDIIGYSSTIYNDNGGYETRLFMRGTPQYVAGSRFKYTPDYIEFSYQNLVNAIADAIDKQSKDTGGKFVTDEATQVVSKDVTYDFEALIGKFQDMVGTLMSRDQSNSRRITAIVDKYLGKGKKVSDCSPDQAEQLDLIIHELEELGK